MEQNAMVRRDAAKARDVPARVEFARAEKGGFAGPDGCRPGNYMWFVGPYGVPKENPLVRDGEKAKPTERKPAEKPSKPETGNSVLETDMLWRMMEAVM